MTAPHTDRLPARKAGWFDHPVLSVLLGASWLALSHSVELVHLLSALLTRAAGRSTLALARETERSESFAAVVRDLAERLARLGGGDPAARARLDRLTATA